LRGIDQKRSPSPAANARCAVDAVFEKISAGYPKLDARPICRPIGSPVVQAALRRRLDLCGARRLLAVARRALPARFATIFFARALRAGLAFFFAILAMFSLSLSLCFAQFISAQKRITTT
jgi:hypothetical protein